MTYCISDVHGEYERYLEMLEKISFSEKDTMYILGDVIDRNPFGIEILKDIMVHSNMIMIRGNHKQIEIWYGPGLIDIDCGCGNNTDMRRLACLRSDDMKEFYV